jgi:hypothetical protein
MRRPPVNLPPLELDRADFEGELVIGCPAELSIYILKRMRFHADRLRAVGGPGKSVCASTRNVERERCRMTATTTEPGVHGAHVDAMADVRQY